MVSGARLRPVCLLHPQMWSLGFHPMMSEKHYAVCCRRDPADGTAGKRIRQTAVCCGALSARRFMETSAAMSWDAVTLALARRFCHFTTDCQDHNVQQ